MGEQRNEGLAPVTYLPWATPSPEPSGDGGSTPGNDSRSAVAAGVTGRHPAGRGLAAGVRAGNDGSEVDSEEQPRGARRRLAVVDDESPAETGVERDERIDRMIVSRLRRSSLSARRSTQPFFCMRSIMRPALARSISSMSASSVWLAPGRR